MSEEYERCYFCGRKIYDLEDSFRYGVGNTFNYRLEPMCGDCFEDEFGVRPYEYRERKWEGGVLWARMKRGFRNFFGWD